MEKKMHPEISIKNTKLMQKYSQFLYFCFISFIIDANRMEVPYWHQHKVYVLCGNKSTVFVFIDHFAKISTHQTEFPISDPYITEEAISAFKPPWKDQVSTANKSRLVSSSENVT